MSLVILPPQKPIRRIGSPLEKAYITTPIMPANEAYCMQMAMAETREQSLKDSMVGKEVPSNTLNFIEWYSNHGEHQKGGPKNNMMQLA
jgi:hypothetical protein